MREIIYGEGDNRVATKTRRPASEDQPFAVVQDGRVIRRCDTWDQAARTRANNFGSRILHLNREERKT